MREPMRAFDEAETARVLVEEYGYTQERVAKALGMAPVHSSVPGAGRVDVRTTRSGKLRVVLEAQDRTGLAKLWTSVSKKL